MKVVILAGGKGTRAYPYTDSIPKPMMPIDGQPILLHLMQIFIQQGFHEFIISLGWRKDVIIDYFRQNMFNADIQLVDTGVETDTGGRIEKCKHLLGDTFLATYGDGLSDVSLDQLVNFHRCHDGVATLTSVPLRSQYGTVVADDEGRINKFQEKPILHDHWINAGFFIFDKEVFDHWPGSNLERDVLPSLARHGLVYAYKHPGFFKSMDTYKDQLELEQMCRDGLMPWKNLLHRGMRRDAGSRRIGRPHPTGGGHPVCLFTLPA